MSFHSLSSQICVKFPEISVFLPFLCCCCIFKDMFPKVVRYILLLFFLIFHCVQWFCCCGLSSAAMFAPQHHGRNTLQMLLRLNYCAVDTECFPLSRSLKTPLTSKINCYQIRRHYTALTQTHPPQLSPVKLFHSSLPAAGTGSNSCQLSVSQSHKRLTSQQSQGSSSVSQGPVCASQCVWN